MSTLLPFFIIIIYYAIFVCACVFNIEYLFLFVFFPYVALVSNYVLLYKPTLLTDRVSRQRIVIANEYLQANGTMWLHMLYTTAVNAMVSL